jgi:hypothetical protein
LLTHLPLMHLLEKQVGLELEPLGSQYLHLILQNQTRLLSRTPLLMKPLDHPDNLQEGLHHEVQMEIDLANCYEVWLAACQTSTVSN